MEKILKFKSELQYELLDMATRTWYSSFGRYKMANDVSFREQNEQIKT